MTNADRSSPAGREGMEHRIKGKLLSECSCDELAREGSDGEALAAMEDGWTPEQAARLTAVWAAYDAKPEAERQAWEKRCEDIA